MDYSAFHKHKNAAPQHLEVGKKGEDAATKFLDRLGYEIRERNIRLNRDEIDILAFDPSENILVFVEVKSLMKSYDEFTPEMSFHHRKRARLKRAASQWLEKKKYEEDCRFDLVTVIDGRVAKHFKDVMGEDDVEEDDEEKI